MAKNTNTTTISFTFSTFEEETEAQQSARNDARLALEAAHNLETADPVLLEVEQEIAPLVLVLKAYDNDVKKADSKVSIGLTAIGTAATTRFDAHVASGETTDRARFLTRKAYRTVLLAKGVASATVERILKAIPCLTNPPRPQAAEKSAAEKAKDYVRKNKTGLTLVDLLDAALAADLPVGNAERALAVWALLTSPK